MGNILQKLSAPKKKGVAERVFHCQICLNPISPTKKFTNKNECSHVFCKVCIAKYVGSKLEINAIEITCPGDDCKTVLDPISCRAIIKNKMFQRWLDLLCYSAIAGLDKCYCPYENCRALIVNECGGNPTGSKCPKCKRWYCFWCRKPWHNGRPCDLIRRDMISLNDMLFMELTVGKKKVTSCPNCHMYTELIPALGYCIIKCRCRTVFCFHCGRERTRVSCDCHNYKEEINLYTFCLYLKYLLFIIPIGLVLIIWAIKNSDGAFF